MVVGKDFRCVETRRPSGDARSDAGVPEDRNAYATADAGVPEDRNAYAIASSLGRANPPSPKGRRCANRTGLTSRRESGLTLLMRAGSNFASLQGLSVNKSVYPSSIGFGWLIQHDANNMKQLILTQVFALWLGIFLLCSSPTYAQQQVQSSCSQELVASKCVKSISQIMPKLAQANVVYLGETHDSLEDHKNQLKIIRELYQTNPKIAIALEMFQRQSQGIVNQYLAGKLTEEELLEKSEYKKTLGFSLGKLCLNPPVCQRKKTARLSLKHTFGNYPQSCS